MTTAALTTPVYNPYLVGTFDRASSEKAAFWLEVAKWTSLVALAIIGGAVAAVALVLAAGLHPLTLGLILLGTAFVLEQAGTRFVGPFFDRWIAHHERQADIARFYTPGDFHHIQVAQMYIDFSKEEHQRAIEKRNRLLQECSRLLDEGKPIEGVRIVFTEPLHYAKQEIALAALQQAYFEHLRQNPTCPHRFEELCQLHEKSFAEQAYINGSEVAGSPANPEQFAAFKTGAIYTLDQVWRQDPSTFIREFDTSQVNQGSAV